MEHSYKFRSKYFLTGILTAIMFFTQTWKTMAYADSPSYFYKPLTDTTRPVNPSDSGRKILSLVTDTTKLPVIDTSLKPKTDTFSLKLSKDSLEAPLKYEAADSAVVLIQDKKIILYNKTKT